MEKKRRTEINEKYILNENIKIEQDVAEIITKNEKNKQ